MMILGQQLIPLQQKVILSSADSSSTDADPWGAGSGTENIDTSSTGSDWLDATQQM